MLSKSVSNISKGEIEFYCGFNRKLRLLFHVLGNEHFS